MKHKMTPDAESYFNNKASHKSSFKIKCSECLKCLDVGHNDKKDK